MSKLTFTSDDVVFQYNMHTHIDQDGNHTFMRNIVLVNAAYNATAESIYNEYVENILKEKGWGVNPFCLPNPSPGTEMASNRNVMFSVMHEDEHMVVFGSTALVDKVIFDRSNIDYLMFISKQGRDFAMQQIHDKLIAPRDKKLQTDFMDILKKLPIRII